MAGAAFGDGGDGKRAHLYEYRITGYFIFSCIVAALGGSLFGYDLGVSGGVTSMDDFLKEFFPKTLVSTFAASTVTRQKGRRASILVGSVSFFLGGLVNAFAKNIAMLIIGRVFLGFGIGFGNQAVPLYLSEMAPAKIRGAVNQLFQLTTCLGILVANFINYGTDKIHPWGWRLSLGLATLTGNNSILFYAPVIFQSLGFGSGAALYSSAITSGALVVAALISMAFVDKFGRRAFFLEAGAEMIMCNVTVAVTLALKFGQGVEIPKGIGIFLVIVICIFVLAFGRSWGPWVGWLVPSELFPLETRSAGQSMVVCINMIFTAALIAQCFLASLCHLKYGIFLLFAGLILIMSTFIFFLLPETKQVPIEEIHFLFEKHWFWKRYVCTNNDAKPGQQV
ncbi:sugar transporter 14 [Actinidia rufa]|uniref:Sugar transporter 14 n=1 Tax=Actinidia rufa TaxID=165716 RepID=A0A7J0DS25_9ERIC|nr:sugar transporter 14 [Actinidia rufa]